MSHLKRLTAPKAAHILKKAKKFLVSPKPGAHPKDKSIALMVLLRDTLKIAEDRKHGRYLLSSRQVLVDNKPRKSMNLPIGFMDTITVGKDSYRMVFDKKGRLVPIKIKAKESLSKICMIVKKTIVNGGKLQITLHDGRNIIIPKKSAKKYANGASVLISLPEQEIIKYIPYEKGSEVFMTAGKHIGSIAKVIKILGEKVLLKSEGGNEFETKGMYAFPISKEVSVR